MKSSDRPSSSKPNADAAPADSSVPSAATADNDVSPAAPNHSVPDTKQASRARGRSGTTASAVSQSLRKVYESTLDEAIPDSMMDLLRQLR